MRSPFPLSPVVALVALTSAALPNAAWAQGEDAPVAVEAPVAAETPAASERSLTPEVQPLFETPHPSRPHYNPGRGILTGDQYRYQHYGLFPGLGLRIVMDMVAIPSGIVAWDAKDWTVFGLTVGATAALTVPFQPHSLDVNLQNKINNVLGGTDHPKIWTPYGDMIIWLSIWAVVGSTFLYGLVGKQPEYVEVAALALEAFVVAQVYMNVIKLVTGREGPNDNIPEGAIVSEGRFYGPAGFVKLFPSGLPSGHVTTMYAMAAVFMEYFNTPALWIGLNMFGILFCATIISDNYHFVSEVLLGAVLGFCIGEWVVYHRSSKFENDADGLPRRLMQAVVRNVSLGPLITPNGGLGAVATVRF